MERTKEEIESELRKELCLYRLAMEETSKHDNRIDALKRELEQK